jgi:hypothetical protein
MPKGGWNPANIVVKWWIFSRILRSQDFMMFEIIKSSVDINEIPIHLGFSGLFS